MAEIVGCQMIMVSRRNFIQKSSAAAGLGFLSLKALGFVPEAPLKIFDLHSTDRKAHVAILGAGLAGMTAGWELRKLGYQVTILEARKRTGGRVWTVRGGDQEKELDKPNQVCRFDKGQYLNAGAARIPHHHALTMHYCKALGVPLEAYNNINEGAYFYSEHDKGSLANMPVRIREIHNDIRGYLAELMHKCLSADGLDQPLTSEDQEKILEYLRVEGALDIDRLYKGSSRRGYRDYPGAGSKAGRSADAFLLSDIIESGFLDPSFSNLPEYDLNLQQTLFQPVGGMDQISKALEQQVSDDLVLDAQVLSVISEEEKVAITYTEAGEEKQLVADYCICTLPLPVLGKVTNNFRPALLRAIDYVPYNKTGKIGFQFNRRFWEEDDAIYGGISRTNMDITQIFYPNTDYQSDKGVLVGYYNFGDKAERFAELSLAEREQLALQQGAKIHPQYKDHFENSFSLAWHKIPYSEGGWAQYSEAARKRFYPELIKPEGRVYMAGEHTTYLTAWMAGAFESARRSVDLIHARVNESQPQYETTEP